MNPFFAIHLFWFCVPFCSPFNVDLKSFELLLSTHLNSTPLRKDENAQRQNYLQTIIITCSSPRNHSNPRFVLNRIWHCRKINKPNPKSDKTKLISCENDNYHTNTQQCMVWALHHKLTRSTPSHNNAWWMFIVVVFLFTFERDKCKWLYVMCVPIISHKDLKVCSSDCGSPIRCFPSLIRRDKRNI